VNTLPDNVIEAPALRDRIHVFRDRTDAGERLARMLSPYRETDALILAIPAGGVPVAAPIARALNLPLDVLVASKVLLPWTTEAGYGAVAFDGSVWINPDYVAHYGLDEATVKAGVAAAQQKVARRERRFRGDRPFPDLAGRTVILVDDGLAAGSTLRAALAALKKRQPAAIVIAVPTGHLESVRQLAREVDTLVCPNIRGGFSYAVADAYRHWHDESEEEVEAILRALASEAAGD